MRYSLTIICASLLLLCGCYDRHSNPDNTSHPSEVNTTIGELQRLCANGLYNITTESICTGRVTSSDREGNFYRTLVVEGETGALELKLGTYNSASQFPVGLELSLHLKGTSLMMENGVMQVGLPPRDYDKEPREFESQATIDRHIVRSSSVEPIAPLCCTPQRLDTSLCGRFVRIEGLHRSPSELDDDNKGYYRFCDDNGGEIFVEISPYATFSLPDTADSYVSVQGILYHCPIGVDRETFYVIKVRFDDDISIGSDMPM